jgi:uncharacterized protein YbjT (DUF2867 family)
MLPLSRRRLPAVLLALAGLPGCWAGPAVAASLADAPTADVVPGTVVAVAGARGRSGQLIVRELLAAGYRVRALTRTAAASGSWPAGVEVQTADARAAATLAGPLAGTTALVIAIGARPGEPGNSPRQVDFEGVRNLAAAASAAGLARVVLVSSAGATRPDHPLNRRFDDVLAWKAKGEAAVRAAGVPYTIVRPGGLTDVDAGPRGVRLSQGGRNTGFVSRADLARVIVAALREPGARNRSFELHAGGGAPPSDWGVLFAALAADSDQGEPADVR